MRNKTMGYAVALAIGLFAFAIAGYLLVDMIINAHAEEVSLGATVRWNCENFHTSPHPLPVSIETDDNGNWSVLLEDGSVLIGNTFYYGEYRFMKWQLDSMSWWVCPDGKTTVYCESDAKSLSICLSK